MDAFPQTTSCSSSQRVSNPTQHAGQLLDACEQIYPRLPLHDHRRCFLCHLVVPVVSEAVARPRPALRYVPPGIPLALPEDAQLTSLVMTKHIQNFLTSDTALISEVGMEPIGMNGMQW